jgi:hypothetical protein
MPDTFSIACYFAVLPLGKRSKFTKNRGHDRKARARFDAALGGRGRRHDGFAVVEVDRGTEGAR